jgi:hypothetical protein
MMTWIANNKEWLFSGVGITVISAFLYFLKSQFSKRNLARENGGLALIRSDLAINIEKAAIKHIESNDYFFQINITITANNGSHTLKRFWLKAKSNRLFDENQGPLYTETGMLIARAFPFQEKDLLGMRADAAKHIIDGISDAQFLIRDKAIPEGQTISLSVLGKILPARMPDGWEDMDLDGWQIIFEYDQNEKVSLPFGFLVHKSSAKYCVRWAYTGFSGRILSDSEHDYA